MIVVGDTSALFAAVDRAQAEHEDCRAVLRSARLVISPLVLTELDHLVQRDLGWEAAVAVLDAVLSRVDAGQDRLAELSRKDFDLARQVRTRYASLRLDLADCVGIALAMRYRTNEIFTLDQRDFRAVETLDPRFSHFRLLPADGLPDVS